MLLSITSALPTAFLGFCLLFRALLSQRHATLLQFLERHSDNGNDTQRSHRYQLPLNLKQRDNHHIIKFEYYPSSLAERCGEDSKPHLELLVLVLSSPGNRNARKTIRQTWANPSFSQGVKERRAKVFFIVGNVQQAKEGLQNEIDVHDDIIIVDVEDTYMNIVYKVFSIIHIAGNLCDASFTLKVDEDVVFHVDRFLDGVDKSFFPDRSDIYCHVYHEKRPIRIEWLDWYVSPEQFAGEIYPDFCAGPSYVLTRKAAKQILNHTHLFPDIQVEDVLITGLISEEAGVNRIACQHMFEHDNYIRRECPTQSDGTPALIAKHDFKTHAAMATAWKRLSAKECPRE